MNKSHRRAPETQGLKTGFWTPNRILMLIVAGAFIVRLAATLTRQMIQADEVAYVRLAENLAAGNGYLDITGLPAPVYTPLLPFFIAGFAFILQNYVIAGYAVVIIFGSLLLVPVYLLGRDLFSERIGLMAAALMAVMPFFIGTSEFIYPEVLYIFFLFMGLFFGWHFLKWGRITCGAAAGISLGLAYLANPGALFYIFALLGLAAVVFIKRLRPKRLAAGSLVFVLTFLIFAIPYLLFLHGETGQWSFTGKNMAGVLYSATHDIRREDVKASEKSLLSLSGENGEPLALTLARQNANPFSFMLEEPKAAVKNFLKQASIFHGSILGKVFPLWLLPVVGLGLFGQAWTRQRAAAFGYLLLMMSPIFLILSFYAHGRYFMSYIPIAAIVAAIGWYRLEAWGRQTAEFSFSGDWSKRLAGRMPWLIGAAVLLPSLLFAGVMLKQQNYQTQYKLAGQWLYLEVGAGARIMNRDFSSSFYAEGTSVILPYADYDAMTGYARSQAVDYLIVSRKDLEDYRPEQLVLLEDDEQHPDWKLIHVVLPGSTQETLIFERVK